VPKRLRRRRGATCDVARAPRPVCKTLLRTRRNVGNRGSQQSQHKNVHHDTEPGRPQHPTGGVRGDHGTKHDMDTHLHTPTPTQPTCTSPTLHGTLTVAKVMWHRGGNIGVVRRGGVPTRVRQAMKPRGMWKTTPTKTVVGKSSTFFPHPTGQSRSRQTHTPGGELGDPSSLTPG
jgi:hypothetical protein